METARLLISAIVADEKFNARKKYDPEVIDTLAKDIAKNGQYNPLLVSVHPTKPGKYFLISGFTRLKALEQIEENTKEPQTAFVQITEASEKLDQYLLNLGENIQRRELSYYDVASRVTEIADEFEMTASQIGARVGLGAKHVSNYIRIIKKVKPEILEQWKEGHPKATTMNLTKLAALSEDEQSATWDELCGIVPEGEDEGEDEGGTGASDSDSAEKKRRPSESILASAIVAAQESDIDANVKKGILAALRFAIGKAKTIPGVYNPAKPPKSNGKSAEGSEASA